MIPIRKRAAHQPIAEAHALFDRRLAPMLQAERRKGVTIPCRAGCSACCDEPLYAPRSEARLAADLVRAMPAPLRAGVEERLRNYVARLVASPLSQEMQPDATAFRRLRLTCPLLKDRRCLIYQDRPLGCRAHIAQGSAAGCEDLGLRPSQKFAYVVPATVEVFNLALPGAELDHFAILLHQELFGEGPRTGAAIKVEWADADA